MPYYLHILNQLIGRALPKRPPDKPTLQGVHIISGSVEERSLQKSTIKIVIVGQLFLVLYCQLFSLKLNVRIVALKFGAMYWPLFEISNTNISWLEPHLLQKITVDSLPLS